MMLDSQSCRRVFLAVELSQCIIALIMPSKIDSTFTRDGFSNIHIFASQPPDAKLASSTTQGKTTKSLVPHVTKNGGKGSRTVFDYVLSVSQHDISLTMRP